MKVLGDEHGTLRGSHLGVVGDEHELDAVLEHWLGANATYRRGHPTFGVTIEPGLWPEWIVVHDDPTFRGRREVAAAVEGAHDRGDLSRRSRPLGRDRDGFGVPLDDGCSRARRAHDEIGLA